MPEVTSKVAGRPTLVAVERKRGRAWPTCVARELLDDEGRRISAPMYPWCQRHGKWLWGEQHLCDLHAIALGRDRSVSGIAPNGQWGGCVRHIDCVHSIDDPDWETVWRVLPPAPTNGSPVPPSTPNRETPK